MQVYYLRHGLSELNKKGLYGGHTDTPLADEGRQQARAAAAGSPKFDLILCSPLARAKHTAEEFATATGYPIDNIEILPELIERNFGELEKTEWSPKHAATLSIIGQKAPYKNIEQIDDLLIRGKTVLDFLAHHPKKPKKVLLVGHGAIGRAIRYHAKPGANFLDKIPNAELVRWM